MSGSATAYTTVLEICRRVAALGGRALLVGGWVRDRLLGDAASDYDLEVFGIAPDRLQALLQDGFKVDVTGKAFGVIKLKGLPIDVSVPRREAKTGPGHRGFLIDADPDMDPAEAVLRRDFTINAMAFDPLSEEVLDSVGGRQDLQAKILRHTSDRFTEDPLRVLRGMQLCARFGLTAAAETIALSRTVGLEGLAPERIFEEWRKLILLGGVPSLGLVFLRSAGWLKHFPELQALIGCPQDPRWHPEGDVWTHTLCAMDAFAAARSGHPDEDLVVGLAVLCHDLGKQSVTVDGPEGIVSRGHGEAGEEPLKSFLGRMTRQTDLAEQVLPLVREHMRPRELFEARASDAAVRRLADRVGRIDRLVRVAEADQSGRPGATGAAGVGFPPGVWLLERAAALQVEASAPVPLILGRHLVGLGRQPGPGFKPILDACYQAQLDGRFTDEPGGLTFLEALLADGG